MRRRDPLGVGVRPTTLPGAPARPDWTPCGGLAADGGPSGQESWSPLWANSCLFLENDPEAASLEWGSMPFRRQSGLGPFPRGFPSTQSTGFPRQLDLL